MDEKRPITAEQLRIKAWAKKTNTEPPPDAQVDEYGLLHGSCVKFGLGKSNEDDVALISRLKAEGYDVKSSKDNMFWEWTIPKAKHDDNLRIQHEKAIRQTQPQRNTLVSAGESGYTEIAPTQETVPISVDDLLKVGPENQSAYESTLMEHGQA